MKLIKPGAATVRAALSMTNPGAMGVYTLVSRLPRRPRRVVRAVAVSSIVVSAAKLVYDNSPTVKAQVDHAGAQCVAWAVRLSHTAGAAGMFWKGSAEQYTAEGFLALYDPQKSLSEVLTEYTVNGMHPAETDETEKATEA